MGEATQYFFQCCKLLARLAISDGFIRHSPLTYNHLQSRHVFLPRSSTQNVALLFRDCISVEHFSGPMSCQESCLLTAFAFAPFYRSPWCPWSKVMLIGNWPRRRYVVGVVTAFVSGVRWLRSCYRWPYLVAKFAVSRNLPRLQQRQQPKATAKTDVSLCRQHTLLQSKLGKSKQSGSSDCYKLIFPSEKYHRVFSHSLQLSGLLSDIVLQLNES